MSEIGIFTQVVGDSIDRMLPELVTAAGQIKEVSGEPVAIYAFGEGVSSYKKEMNLKGVDKLHLIETPGAAFYQTDALSKVVADILKAADLSVLLIPATKVNRELMSRVQMSLGLGMTSDVTELKTEVAGGKTIIHQIKPSFGSQVMVSCDITEGIQLITIRQGFYDPAEGADTEVAADTKTAGREESAISCDNVEKTATVDYLTGAPFVVCAGKGTLENHNLDLVKEYAKKQGAVVAGSRPIADQGYIPFEYQIGESGIVIRPDICLIFGVSGAIQFTEGIKGDPLIIAVNSDEYAPIFHFADYMVAEDMHDILEELNK